MIPQTAGGQPSVKSTRTLGGLLVGVVLTLILGGSAAAEGAWTSSISGALTGFESRRWTDNNNDSVSTTVNFQGCRLNLQPTTSVSATLNLYRDRTGLPDVALGEKTFSCYNSGTGSWGDVQSGTYHFTLKKINGATSGKRLWVSHVGVGY